MTSLTQLTEHHLPAGLTRFVPAATVAATVGCGLMAGILFIFSSCIMPTLRQQPVPAAIATMQSINKTILNPLFLLVLVGSTLLCVVLGLAALVTDGPGRGLRIAAVLTFLVGVIAVTAAINVPLNDELATVLPGSAHGADVWQHYLSRWTAWNDVRAAAATVATALLAWSARK